MAPNAVNAVPISWNIRRRSNPAAFRTSSSTTGMDQGLTSGRPGGKILQDFGIADLQVKHEEMLDPNAGNTMQHEEMLDPI